MERRDLRVRTYREATRILAQEGVRQAEVLLQPGAGQATIWGRPGAFFSAGGSVLLDFSKELHGGVQILSGGAKNNAVLQLRITFGESASEAMAEPNDDHAIHRTILDVPPMGWMEYGTTGFRFVRLEAVTPGVELELKEVRAVSLLRDLEYRGAFSCSDRRLNEIWRTAAYTTHLCLQDYVWDGIKRDRLVWMGDMHPEAMVAGAVFGRTEVVERSLDLMRDQTVLPEHMNGIGSYSLWWIITHRDWFRLHGAFDYLQGQREYLQALLRLVLDTMVGADDVECMQGRRFLDWPSGDSPENLRAGLHALVIVALEAGAELCDPLGNRELAEECRIRVGRMRRKTFAPVPSKQVNALQALAGVRPTEEMNRLSLAVDPLRGVSTFYGYYILQARAAAEDYAGCLELIRRYWGGMIDLGATSFWEHFELDWMENAGRIDELPVPGKRDVHKDCGAYCFKGLRHSFCHGWASGPAAWLAEHVLGVKILRPGATEVAVVPHLEDLDWAEGRFPTPHGNIELVHEKQRNGTIRSEIHLPAGVTQRAI